MNDFKDKAVAKLSLAISNTREWVDELLEDHYKHDYTFLTSLYLVSGFLLFAFVFTVCVLAIFIIAVKSPHLILWVAAVLVASLFLQYKVAPKYKK